MTKGSLLYLQGRAKFWNGVARYVLRIFLLAAVIGALLVADIFFDSNDFLVSIGPPFKGQIVATAMAILAAIYGVAYGIGEHYTSQAKIVAAQEQQDKEQAEADQRNLMIRSIDEFLTFPAEVLERRDGAEPSEVILKLQLMLALSGQPVPPNRIFDKTTEDAVHQAQERFRIKRDGKVGITTWSALRDDIRGTGKGNLLLKDYAAAQPALEEARRQRQSPPSPSKDGSPSV